MDILPVNAGDFIDIKYSYYQRSACARFLLLGIICSNCILCPGLSWMAARPYRKESWHIYYSFLFCLHELLPGKRVYPVCDRPPNGVVGEIVESSQLIVYP